MNPKRSKEFNDLCNDIVSTADKTYPLPFERLKIWIDNYVKEEERNNKLINRIKRWIHDFGYKRKTPIIGTNTIICQRTRDLLFGKKFDYEDQERKEKARHMLAAIFVAEMNNHQEEYDIAIHKLDVYNKEQLVLEESWLHL
jgi:hypothetical protein